MVWSLMSNFLWFVVLEENIYRKEERLMLIFKVYN